MIRYYEPTETGAVHTVKVSPWLVASGLVTLPDTPNYDDLYAAIAEAKRLHRKRSDITGTLKDARHNELRIAVRGKS